MYGNIRVVGSTGTVTEINLRDLAKTLSAKQLADILEVYCNCCGIVELWQIIWHQPVSHLQMAILAIGLEWLKNKQALS